MNKKRSRRRGRGSLTPYATKSGTRWQYQIYVPVDPENPDLGDRRLTRGGFATQEEADEALSDAVKKNQMMNDFMGSHLHSRYMAPIG